MKYLQPDTYFHVFNRANGNEKLFRNDGNYTYFIKQWIKYIDPIARTYAYCLMPNHFHALIKIRDEKVIKEYFSNKKPDPAALSVLLSKQFSNLFNSYAKAYNKMYKRMGSLFIRPFKAKKIMDNNYLTNVISYIHYNPIHHKFTTHLEDWPYSSYSDLLTEEETFLFRKGVIEWFGNREEFIRFHENFPLNLSGLINLTG